MDQPRVSVIVCAYNAEKTIEGCLNSLFAQTFREFEIVVVDDESSDATASEVERLSAGSSCPVRLVRIAHEGLAGARNHGIDAALGERFAFVDADDTADPRMIEHMLACAEATGASLVVCQMRYTDFDTGAELHINREGDSSLYGAGVLDRPGLLAQIGASVCNKLVHRSLFGGGIRFPTGHNFEDLWVTYRLCGEANLIAKVDEPLYNYRFGRGGSIMRSYTEQYLEIADALAETNDYFLAKGDFEALRDDLLVVNFTHLLLGRLDNLLAHGTRPLRRRYLDVAFAHLDRYFAGWRRSPSLRAVVGGRAKRFVLVHRPLLSLYTDVIAGSGPR